MVNQKEIIEAFEQALNWANARESDGYAEHWLDRKSSVAVNWSLIRQTIRRLETEGIAPNPYVPMTDEQVGMLTVFDGLHNVETPILAEYIRNIEAAVIKRAGLEIKQ